MDSPADYGAYIIDITNALLQHRRGLTEMQAEQIETMHRRAVGFVTDYLEKEVRPLEEFRSYLNHDAMSPLTIIVGYAEMMLMGASGDLGGVYREAVEEIRACAYTLMDELKEIYQAVINLLQNSAFAS